MNKIMFNMTKKSNTHRRSGNTGSIRAAPDSFKAVLWYVFLKLTIKFFGGHGCFTAESRYCKVIQEWHPTKLLDDSPMLSVDNQ